MKEFLIYTGEVLKEFQDVMPKELPNKLPPRREVDLEIELESSSKPPSGAPYRMAPPELEELGKKLKELLDVGSLCCPGTIPMKEIWIATNVHRL